MSTAIQCVVPEPLSLGLVPVSGPQIGGLIEIEANARVDKDTAEVLEEFGGTLLTQVEQLPAAVILGGYLSGTSGVYNSGAQQEFRYPVDTQDRYCIDLEPGQAVEVQVFSEVSEAAGNTRLRLLRTSDGAPVSGSGFSSNDAKRVELPADAAAGTYVIDFETDDQAGPLRYVLSSSPTGSSLNLSWSPGDFVPGEAVVMLREGAGFSAQSATSGAQMNLARALGGNQHKVTMPPMLMAQGQSPGDLKQQTIDWVRELRERSDVLSASPNYIFTAQAAFESVGEPLYPDQWHYPLINVPQAWQLAPEGGAGVKVAVLDTGLFRFDGNWHEDLPSLNCDLSSCFDFIDGDVLPIDPGSAVGGSVYHGTHVAGTVAANGLNDLGGTGVAPSAQIMPARVLDENGSGTLSEIVDAINWARENGADVINLSLGSPSNSAALVTAVDEAAAAGILMVAAAGNSPNEKLVYPAALDKVFGVGAVDGAGVRAGYSNIGASVDLVGPGGDASRDANQDGRADVVVSTSGNASGFTYAGLQGTSMATPHVSGVFALMKQLDSSGTLNTELVKGLLANGAITAAPPPGQAGYGAGLIDSAKAVQAASGSMLALLSPVPVLLEFGTQLDDQVLELDRVGNADADIVIESIRAADAAPWLSAGVAEESADGFSVLVSVDRSLLETGRAYRSELRVEYTSNGEPFVLSVPVVVAVDSPTAAREAGLHFVLLIDETGRTAAQTALTSTGGFYTYAFEVVADAADKFNANQVVAGRSYYLVAGTDLDNDGLICAPGEACAEYPIAGLRERISVVLNDDGTAHVETVEPDGVVPEVIPPEDLVMTTSFSRPLSAQSLPRPGFEGYKLLESAHQVAPRSVAEW